MESQPQNPEFRINPENFHPCCCHLSYPNVTILAILNPQVATMPPKQVLVQYDIWFGR